MQKERRIYQMDAATADHAAFPRASRVVRFGSDDWSSEDDDLLQQLSDVIERRTKERRHGHVEALLEPAPRVRTSCGSSHVYLLYGARPIWVDAASQIQVDMRGLVFEPVTRLSNKRNLAANF